MTGLLVALVLTAAPPPNGAMALYASNSKARMAVQVLPADEVLTKNGADWSEIHTQVEVALRRCGIAPVDPVRGPQTILLVQAAGLSQEGRGYAGNVQVTVRTAIKHLGVWVLLDVYSDGTLFTGPPGAAGGQLREVLNGLLDGMCNEYLRARERR